MLNYARGFRERDIAFIRGLPVRRLNVLARTLTDLSPMYEVAGGLISLSVQSDPRATIDLKRLPSLRSLSADWQQVHRSIRFAPDLERLFLAQYAEADLTPLASLPSLTSVVMKEYPQIRSLDGVEELPWLAELGVHLGKNLEDIAALARAASPVLTALQLPSCRKVTDITSVALCTSLRFFELSEGGDLPTVAPLAELGGLVRLYLYGSTKVLDGDLTPIARLPHLRDFRMQSRRSYSPSVKEIQDTLGGVGRVL